MNSTRKRRPPSPADAAVLLPGPLRGPGIFHTGSGQARPAGRDRNCPDLKPAVVFPASGGEHNGQFLDSLPAGETCRHDRKYRAPARLTGPRGRSVSVRRKKEKRNEIEMKKEGWIFCSVILPAIIEYSIIMAAEFRNCNWFVNDAGKPEIFRGCARASENRHPRLRMGSPYMKPDGSHNIQ